MNVILIELKHRRQPMFKDARLPLFLVTARIEFTAFELQNTPVVPDPTSGDTRLWDHLFLCTHNINGINNNHTKLHHLVEWAHERHINIIGLSETNIDKRNGPFCMPPSFNYDSYWSPRDDKVKGSGIGIIIEKEWAKHIGFIDNNDPYFIHLTLYFKGVTIHIVQLYFPPSDQHIQNVLTSKI